MDSLALKDLAEQKEREWRLIQEQRINALEIALKQKNKELQDEKSKFVQLKDDFKYNLKLLEDRDAELDKYEQSLISTRKQLSEKNAEISELKIKLDDLKNHADSEKTSIDECKKYYLNRLNQKQNEIDKYKSMKDKEINGERTEIEKLKRTLNRQLQDLQIDLEKQRSEMRTEFDEVMRKREHEWRLSTDELNTNILAKELEIKMLKNDIDKLRDENQNLKKNISDLDINLKSAERSLKEKEWELKDSTAISDSKIKDLELKLLQIQSNSKLSSEELSRKYYELERQNREKEMNIEKLKERLFIQEKENLTQSNKINEYKSQIKGLNEEKKDLEGLLEKERALIQQKLDQINTNFNSQIESKVKQEVNNELSIEELRRDNYNLKIQVSDLRTQLSESISKQKHLQQVQLEIDKNWQQKYQNLDNMKAQDQQEFIKQIVTSRDRALEQLKSLEDELNHKNNVIKAIQTADPIMNLAQIDSTQEFQLKEENQRLKQIIKQMRAEMEELAEKDANTVISPPSSNIGFTDKLQKPEEVILKFNNFDEDVKQQLLDAKQKNRQLQAQIDEFVTNQKLPDNISDNTIINSHIKSLNETITGLRKENVDLTTFCKKQQTKLIHIEKNLNDQSENLRTKQAQIETLKYEMSSQARRNTNEISNLKQNIANLELELSTTRREADEYHKAAIKKDTEISALETKIGELKVKLSSSGTQLNFGAQELFIQQLQDEIKRLSSINQQLQMKARQHIHQALRENQNNTSFVDSSALSTSPTIKEIRLIKDVESLKSKLKTAAKFITHLIQEKEHLIEMSNQLRGELARTKYDHENLSLMRINRESELHGLMRSSSIGSLDHRNPVSHDVNLNRPKSASSNRLQQLEQKQYELTKQQLAFAQRKNFAKSEPSLSNAGRSKITTRKPSTSSSTNQSMDDDSNTITSSVKSENLRELWKILDENANSSFLRENDIDDITSSMKVTGLTPNNSNKTKIISKSAPNTARQSAKNPKPKIRNYNIKS